MPTKRWRGKRILLNPKGYESTGAIVAEVEDTRYWPKGKDGDGCYLTGSYRCQPEYILQISDCTRSVSFNLHWETVQDRRASLMKIDRIIDSLAVFREALVDEQRLYAERMKILNS